MISMKKYFLFLVCFASVSYSYGQGLAAQFDTVRTFEPEFRRLINHEAIDREQKNILWADGKSDNVFTVSKNDEINFFVTYAVVNKVDRIQYKIEKDSSLDH